MSSGSSGRSGAHGSAGPEPPARRLLTGLEGAGQTLAVAESCTGGLLGAEVTEAPGASAVFRGGVVAYHDDAKRSLLGVDRALLARHGAVSGEAARAMASGARTRLDATWGVAVTGVAGPGGGTEEKPVGTVWVAVDGPREVARVYRFSGDRRRIREASVRAALELLLEVALPAA